jgi:ABC-type lipoprotein release transport system permease subunit
VADTTGAGAPSPLPIPTNDVKMNAMRRSSAAGLWSQSDLRARVVALVVLGVLTGLTIGLAAAAFDGAQRTDTALSRLQAHTNASDAVLFPSQLGLATTDWTKLEQRPEVKRVIRWGLAFGTLDGDPDGVMFVPMDGVWLQEVDRPVVVAGRMFDPHAADEAVVSDDVSGDDGTPIKVGDSVPFTLLALGGDFDKPPAGPTIDVRVVGVIHTPLSYVFTGAGFLSPGFVEKYKDTAYIAENALVQLRHGGADIAALRRDASTDVAEGTPVLDFQVTSRRVTATTDVEAAMLRLLAMIVALAGVAFVGQALARSAATIGNDAPALRGLGMTRRELVVAGLRPHLLTAGIAVVIAVLTTIVASRWFPVGIAGSVDYARGIRVNVAMVIVAALLAAVVTVAVAGLGSWKAARPTTAEAPRQGTWLARLPVARPIALRVGARMALENGGTRRRGNTLPALVGAAAAVTGVIAILTINHGLTDALAHPEVAGVAWDASVIPNTDDVSLETGIKPAVRQAVADQPGVAAIGTIARYVGQIGELGVPVFTVFEPDAVGAVSLVTLSGRAPRAGDEIVLGPSTADDLDVTIGDTVRLADGGAATVVGLGLFPSDVHAQFDEGAWVMPDRWSRLATAAADPGSGDLPDILVAVRFADHGDVGAEIDALGTALGSKVQGVMPAEEPLELGNLHYVRRLPNVLAVFLAVLGTIAVGHALFSSVYRRRRDFAVLQSLGVTRRGVGAMVAAHATVVGVAGLAFGVPIGLIAGRAGWQAIANRVPLTFRSPLTLIAVVLVVPVALAAANLLAIIPARRASKATPALVLRSE